MPDLSYREWALLGPIAAVVLWMGVYPESFMRPMRADIGRLVERLERSAPEGDSRIKVSASNHEHAGEDHGAH